MKLSPLELKTSSFVLWNHWQGSQEFSPVRLHKDFQKIGQLTLRVPSCLFEFPHNFSPKTSSSLPLSSFKQTLLLTPIPLVFFFSNSLNTFYLNP